MEDRLTKKELKAMRKLERLEGDREDGRNKMIKWVSIAIVSIIFLIGFVWIISFSKQQAKVATTDLSKNGHTKGNPKAKVTLAEFADFQCPHCKQEEASVIQAMMEYKDQLKFVYKYFPLSFQNSLTSARAAQAASLQNKFWEYHDVLFEKQEEWGPLEDPLPKFKEYANQVNLNIEQFEKDYKSPQVDQIVTAQHDEGVQNGVDSTPTFFVNNMRIEYKGYQTLKQAIDEALKQK